MAQTPETVSPALPVPDRLRFHWGDAAVMLVLVTAVIASRLAYMPVVIAHSDGGAYAFALDRFDIARGHPHAPGYPVFVVLAKTFYSWVVPGDANRSLVLASTLLSALGCCALYWWGAVMYGRIAGATAAGLLCFDNNFWRLGVMWMSYTAEAFWGSLLGLACFRALTGAPRWTLWGALILGVGGGFRQQLLPFLGPMWLWGARRSRWWQALLGGAIILAITAAWIGAVSALAGGYHVLREANDAQWRESIYPTSVLAALERGPREGLGAVIERISGWSALVFGGRSHLTALPWLLLCMYAIGRIFRPSDLLRDPRSQLLLVWFIPPVLFHWTIHMNSRCHAVIYYPVLCIVAGAGASLLCRDLHLARMGLQRLMLPLAEARLWPTAGALIAALCLYNIGLFVVRTGPAIRAEARGVQSVIEHIRTSYDPQRTVIVQSDVRGFFHAVQYYLPGWEMYQLEQTLELSRPSLTIPSPVLLGANVDTVVFLYPEARVAGPSERVPLAEGFAVRVARLKPYQRYMHFSPAGVAFWASPHLPAALAIYGDQSARREAPPAPSDE